MPFNVRELARHLVVLVDEARELGEDPMPAAIRFIDDMVDEAERERRAALDEAWDQINALGGPPDDGYAKAIDRALTAIEDLGGMNPERRRVA